MVPRFHSWMADQKTKMGWVGGACLLQAEQLWQGCVAPGALGDGGVLSGGGGRERRGAEH